ncbi:MAG: TIGR02281 family clan AA aspartic protease [Gammaproteobacteria bacterium]|nr:TIGR02281 family clan AA aspartic protease [Gammaproteobacteria bacterium]
MVFGAWILALVLGIAFFQDWFDVQYNPNESVKRTSVAGSSTAIVLQANRYGHYVASGTINGLPVVFLLDTGATSVAIPREVADSLGLKRGTPIVVATANGRAKGYLTRLDRVGLGAIELRNVEGVIAPGMGSNEVLLGMSFLEHLDWRREDGRLVLSAP